MRVASRKETGSIDWTRGAGTWLLTAVLFVFVLPNIESRLTFADGDAVVLGLPIRGYGLMLLTAVLFASFWTYRRGLPYGLNFDELLSLAFWGMVGGIGGARLFYVVQKWSEFESPTLPAS